jgi:hypothetical protein
MGWLAFDICTAVGMVAVSARMGWLGVQVTFYPPEDEGAKSAKRRQFIRLAILAGALTVTQGIRNGVSQNELMATIHDNPPKVEITNSVPPATVIQQPVPVVRLPLSPDYRAIVQAEWNPPFRDVNGAVQVNATLRNRGKLVAVKYGTVGGMVLVPRANLSSTAKENEFESALWSAFKKRADRSPREGSLGLEAPEVFPINTGRPISDDDWNRIQSGELLVFFTFTARYNDDQTRRQHRTDFCGFYWGKDPRVVHACTTGHGTMS